MSWEVEEGVDLRREEFGGDRRLPKFRDDFIAYGRRFFHGSASLF
jgi:hypothetical protein